MKIKVSEASGVRLDWLVGAAYWHPEKTGNEAPLFSPTTDWAEGGPIIERERLIVGPCLVKGRSWFAEYGDEHAKGLGPTPLVAAMRCYCCSKLGDEVEVPDELD